MKKNAHLATTQWLLLFCLPLFSVAQVKQEWITTYNATGKFSPDEATALKVSEQGNVYVAGTTSHKNKGLDYEIIKYDAAGNVIWTQHYNGNLNGNDYATAMWVDDKENVYVTGSSVAGEVVSNYDYATVKYDKDGNRKWVKRYGGGGYDRPTAITADAAGNVYVTGYQWKSEFNFYDYATIKYDKNGNQLWGKIYNGDWEDKDYANAIAVDKNFNVYVAGRSLNKDNNYDYAIVSYKPNGEEQWVARYNGPANANDEANDIKVDASANVYVTGSSSNGSNDEFATIKYNKKGVLQWVNRYAKPDRYTIAKLLILDEKANVYVAGESAGFTTVKYDSKGALQWAADDFGDDNYVDSVTGIAIDKRGNIYVTGSYGDEYSQTTIGIVKYDPTGKKLWEKRIGNGQGIPEWERSRDISVDIDVDAKGNVYIAGAFDDSASLSDIVTIKFNSAGDQQWLKQVNGVSNGNEVLSGMAVDKMGSTYVTGTTDANDPRLDIVTNKYDKDGNKVWSKRIGFKGGAEEVTDIAADAIGNVYITGSVQQYSGRQFLTAKYSTDGHLLWTTRYSGDNPSVNYALEMALDAFGNVYVTGTSDNGQGGPSFATIKYNTNGVQQWAVLYKFNSFYGQKPTDITTDAIGNVYVTGKSSNGNNDDFITIKYNTAGIQQWLSTYNGPDNNNDIPASIEADAAGNVYVTGASSGFVTIKYNSNGGELWVARPIVDSKKSAATDLAIDNAGNVFVTGNLYPAADQFPNYIKVGTIKYNAAGIQQWIKIYEGKGTYFDDEVLSTANEIVLDKLGNIYVSVNDSLQNDTDHETLLTRINRNLVTLKYDGNGNEIWLEKFLVRSSMNTESFIGLDDANNVYVSGMQDGYGTNKDFVITRYSQTDMITRNTSTHDKTTTDLTRLHASAFPNPFNQNFTLRWTGNKGPVSIIITDAAGRLIDRKSNLAATGNMQAGGNYSGGIYYAQIRQGKELIILKLLKQ